VVRGPDEKNSLVSLQSVQLIQEERAVLIIDQTIKVFEDDYARGILSGLPEHFSHGVLFSKIVFGKERYDIGNVTRKLMHLRLNDLTYIGLNPFS
jgi:hypothetical protein